MFPGEENIRKFTFGAHWKSVARSWGRSLRRCEKTQFQKSKRPRVVPGSRLGRK